MEENERVALFLCQAKKEHNRLAPRELYPLPWGTGRGLVGKACGQGLLIWIKAVKSLHSSSDGLMVR